MMLYPSALEQSKSDQCLLMPHDRGYASELIMTNSSILQLETWLSIITLDNLSIEGSFSNNYSNQNGLTSSTSQVSQKEINHIDTKQNDASF